MEFSFLRLRPARTEEISPEAQIGFLSSFVSTAKRSFTEDLLWKQGKRISLEIVSSQQKTKFFLGTDTENQAYYSSQLLSRYPKTLVEETGDPLHDVVRDGQSASIGWLKLSRSYVFPLQTYKQVGEGDPLASVLGFLGKLGEGESAMAQIIVRPLRHQSKVQAGIRARMKRKDKEGNEVRHEFANLMEEKLKTPILSVQVRLLFASTQPDLVNRRLAELAGSYGSFTRAESNTLQFKQVGGKGYEKQWRGLLERGFVFNQPGMILNLEELASLWHMPDKSVANIMAIDWGKTLLSEAPDNLPVAELYDSDEEKREANFFGKTEWRNHEAIFGIRREDRRKHMYVIGKTGAGKSTLIANMAINDIRNGEGVAVIDPHGDLSEIILDYIPKRRVNDVVYLDPTLSTERSFALNLFDADGAAQMDVVASGIVSVFYKLYHYSWGPRLEYILRNAILSLLLSGDATFMDIITILTDKRFRDRIVDLIGDKDPVLKAFWKDEYDQMTDKLRVESISSILNKVGQFLSAVTVRNIVGQKHSSFSFEEIMNQRKILILNLSQGKLGEDSTALLGAMFITKLQLTAMQRVNLAESERADFYLYVDEFQNFATQSFVKILSEARKYRLNLMLANQYIGQVDEDIQKAVFGNVGSLSTFVLGARDAELFSKEFGGVFTGDDLVGLGMYEILLKMSIGGLTSTPFMAKTLPLPSVKNDNREKIMRIALERYYRKV